MKTRIKNLREDNAIFKNAPPKLDFLSNFWGALHFAYTPTFSTKKFL